MADYYYQAVVNPKDIPASLLSKNEEAVLSACGFTVETYGTGEAATRYVYVAENTNSEPDLSEFPLTEEEKALYAGTDPWITVLQQVLRRSREAGKPIGYFTLEAAMTCSKMLPDGFGGHAVFITEEDTEEFGTGIWLSDKIHRFETKGKRACPNCNSENGYNETVCHECGKPFPGTERGE